MILFSFFLTRCQLCTDKVEADDFLPFGEKRSELLLPYRFQKEVILFKNLIILFCSLYAYGLHRKIALRDTRKCNWSILKVRYYECKILRFV